MYAPKARVPSSWKIKLNLTHFIRIPLLNQTSSSQIQKTLEQVASDPVSATVPLLAFHPLQSLNISIVALSLSTQQSRDRAIALLQHLGTQDWQKVFTKAQASPANGRMLSAFSPPPLNVRALFAANVPQSIPCASPQPCLASKVLVNGPRLFHQPEHSLRMSHY